MALPEVYFLGDSFIQAGVDPRGGLPGRLNAEYVAVKSPGSPEGFVYNLGVPGYQAQRLVNTAMQEVENRRHRRLPQVAVVGVGLNDARTDQGTESECGEAGLHIFKERMLHMASNLALVVDRLILIDPVPTNHNAVPYGKFPVSYCPDRVASHAQAVSEVAEETGAGFLGLHDAVLEWDPHLSEYVDPIHLSPKGYDFAYNLLLYKFYDDFGLGVEYGNRQ